MPIARDLDEPPTEGRNARRCEPGTGRSDTYFTRTDGTP